MSPVSETKIRVSPAAVLVLALFVILGDAAVLSALLFAALCHELGHWLILRRMGATVREVDLTPLGAEMKVCGTLSYGQDWLAAAAGPAANLLWAVCLAFMGRRAEIAYLFAGAQAVLGFFNLLPIPPLDGGAMLYAMLAVLWGPYAADRVSRIMGSVVSAALLLGCGGLLFFGGGGFPLLAAIPLFLRSVGEIGLVKPWGKG